jgi:hypothetical protein
MYATLSYDVSAGPTPIDELRRMILEVFADHDTCDLLSDTFICKVDNTADYLALARKLRKVGTDVDGQFQFVFTLHSAGAPLRTNATIPKAKANDILDPGADE